MPDHEIKESTLAEGCFFSALFGRRCLRLFRGGRAACACFYGGGVCFLRWCLFFTAAVAFRGDLHLLFGRHLLFPMAAMPAFFGVGACVFLHWSAPDDFQFRAAQNLYLTFCSLCAIVGKDEISTLWL